MRNSYTRMYHYRPTKKDKRDWWTSSWHDEVPYLVKLKQVEGMPQNDHEWSFQLMGEELWVYIMCPEHHGIVSVRPPVHSITYEKDRTLTIFPSVVCPLPCRWHVFVDRSEVRGGKWRDEWKEKHGSLPPGVKDDTKETSN